MKLERLEIKGVYLYVHFQYQQEIKRMVFRYYGNAEYELIGSESIDEIPRFAKVIFNELFQSKEKVKLISNGFMSPKELIIDEDIFGK